ncbi:MAG: hypothetical protein GY796_00140, partial [Chloroflexi bacterium]|nr:hypothetical protein [Chloroflexota bacterium]
MTKNGHFKLIQSPIFLAGLLFVLALLVRLPYLNTFLTIDEYKWVAGAVEFISALESGHLAQT